MRRIRPIVLALVVLVGGLALGHSAREPSSIPEGPIPQAGLECFRQGGDHDYCSCLDRLATAREAARRPAPALPPLDHPVIRHALRHPGLYPIINGDSLRCLTPPTPPPPGDRAGIRALGTEA